MQNLRLDVDADGIALISFDMPGRSMNVLNDASIRDYGAAVDKVLSSPDIKGAVVTSAKPGFMAGADLDWLLELAESEGTEQERALAVYEAVMVLQEVLRRTENGGKPFVSAIGGLALGGGFELCLACGYRVVADDPSIQLGLPEAKVGLFPGGGGTQRLSRMLGPMQALPLLVEGRTMSPGEALELGLVDEIAPAGEVVARAKARILASGPEDWIKRWDRKGFRAPGDDPRTLDGSLAFAFANALHRKKSYGNYPNLDAIHKAVYDGLNVPLDTALRIEARYFAQMLVGDAARNMVRTQFVNLQKANKLTGRPAGVPSKRIRKVGVLGAGMMGAAIAHVAARSGIAAVVIDRDEEASGKVLSHIRKSSARDVEKGRISPADLDRTLSLVTPTTDYGALGDVDIVIEAVFEDSAVKAEVIARAEAAMDPSAVFASNTSTIPITSLAEFSRRPERFIGMHFFSPVERMPLLEIIMAQRTGSEALAIAMDFARQTRKTPIVVNDSRGFYTSRVFSTYTAEGCHMLMEGISPALIENAGRMAGMPVSPLALSDEVALDLIHRVNLQTARDLGRDHPATPAEALIKRMVEQENRIGKKAGKGFYDYPAGERKRLWHGLADIAPPRADQPEIEELKQRLLVIQALEAARCLEENVVTSATDADIGAYLGWSFAPWTGGPISYIDTLGTDRFVALCRRFEQSCGGRFSPTDGLVELASSGGRVAPQPAAHAV